MKTSPNLICAKDKISNSQLQVMIPNSIKIILAKTRNNHKYQKKNRRNSAQSIMTHSIAHVPMRIISKIFTIFLRFQR